MEELGLLGLNEGERFGWFWGMGEGEE
jgi:hypothetical protein